ncbi:1-hydroxycarotenoid 3,4-desaturase CrtD [Ferruginibacter sp. HRS2-29]|uniref:1-hydroxycarotenoid 3,4-desaturase CrtD n=1 Tax=Ferruginibacter sp. HRS2-29 TaxID=2487334 RepID=UPI0020CD4533|nr:1-hydroxycarotenoid 3,4-desaturase CrtD [Ferruginibacter sp. HRS2-29]MCP9749945.1 phytoene desaturase [Ferruginibacter sp. HRS2-29]
MNTQEQSSHHAAHRPSAVVIGSGIAGMAAAIRLAVQGMEVTVYEKNANPGGKLSVFEQEGYRFDAGPSLFTQPENIEQLFELAGEPIEQYFTYKKCDVSCNYFYENGRQVTAYTGSQKLAAELHEKLGENEQVVTAYLSDSRKLYDDIGSIFLNHSLHKRRTWLHRHVIRALASVKPAYLFGTLNNYNKKKFASAETTQLFNRYATYNGSSPYQAPAMLSLIPHLELNQGTYYPHGGMISIANALHRLAVKKGVKFHFGSNVERIIETEGAARGVVVDGKNILYDIVVSNVDAYFTYQRLLHKPVRAQKVLKQERSSSALIFYWGINRKFDELGLHNIFFSKNYQQEFDTIFNSKKLFGDPTVYINITSKHDTDHAPAGTENWFVMINVPANTGQDWEQLKLQAREAVITKLSRMLQQDITPLIATERILDPVGIEAATASYQGSLYGTSSNSPMAAFFRHANFNRKIRQLYFCGGSVHPGGGIPLCFKSAQIVSGLIKEQLRIKN